MPTINDPVITFTIAAEEFDWTDQTASATFEGSKAVISRPHFGDKGQNLAKKGLWNGSLKVDLDADYGVDQVTQTLWAALASDALVDVAIRAKDAAISTSNPEWRMQVAVTQMPVIDGDAGSLATHSITLPIHGEPTLHIAA